MNAAFTYFDWVCGTTTVKVERRGKKNCTVVVFNTFQYHDTIPGLNRMYIMVLYVLNFNMWASHTHNTIQNTHHSQERERQRESDRYGNLLLYMLSARVGFHYTLRYGDGKRKGRVLHFRFWLRQVEYSFHVLLLLLLLLWLLQFHQLLVVKQLCVYLL